MIAVIVAGVLFLVGLWFLFRQFQMGRGHSEFVLASLPLVLLFFTAPIPLSVWQMIEGFRRIGESRAGGIATIAPLCLGIARSQRFGAALSLFAMGIAAVLQLRTDGAGPGLSPPSENSLPSESWGRWMLLAFSVLVIPAVVLSQFTLAIPRLIMSVVTPGALRASDVGTVSATLSARLIVAMLSGVVMSGVLLGAALASHMASYAGGGVKVFDRYPWVVLAATGAFAIWTVLDTTGSIRQWQLLQ